MPTVPPIASPLTVAPPGPAAYVHGRVYRQRLLEANRWAALAGAPLEVWVEQARRFGALAQPLGLPPGASTAAPTPEEDLPLHRAARALHVRTVVERVLAGDDVNRTIPPAAIDPLNAALGMSTNVWNNIRKLFDTLQWRAEELDAQAIVVGLLLAAGARVNEATLVRAMNQDNPALTALVAYPWGPHSPHAAGAWPALPSRLAAGTVRNGLPAQAMRHLLHAGWDLNAASGAQSPLEAATSHGNSDMVIALLDLGARPERPSALLLSAIREHGQHAEVIRRLIALGAPVNAPDELGLGMSPLYTAAVHDAVPAIQALLAAGATVDTPDSLGRTPLYAAAERGNADSVDALLAAGADHRVRAHRSLALADVARARLNQPDTDGDDHRTVRTLETLALNDALAEVGHGPSVPHHPDPGRSRSRL